MGKVLFSENLKEEFLNRLDKDMPFENEEVVIKLHMGEPENPNHMKPEEVKPFIKILKKKGCKPFLFDTTVKYGGKRKTVEGHLKTARKNGFSEEEMGCPIVVGGDENTKIDGSIEFEIAEKIKNKSMLILTHVKGHAETGIGAAIKNVGIGCVTKKTKGEMHSKNDFITKMVESSKAALSQVNKIYCVNFLKRMAKGCDCENHYMEPVMEDIGILAGKDILAIDMASYNLIKKKAGKDIFEELQGVSFQEQLDHAEKMKLGNKDYKLERV